jgi:hypothetical protein
MALSVGQSLQVAAQPAPGRSLVLEEVIVSARRRDETLQDVPLIRGQQLNYVYSKTEEQIDRLTSFEIDTTYAIDISSATTPSIPTSACWTPTLAGK